MPTVKGRIVNTNRRVTTSGGIDVIGVKPLIIVYVKSSARHQKDFAFRCRVGGIDATPIDENGAFEATGTPEALEFLTGCSCVRHWHFALNVRIPWQGTGSGEEKRVVPLWKERLLADPDYSRDDV